MSPVRLQFPRRVHLFAEVGDGVPNLVDALVLERGAQQHLRCPGGALRPHQMQRHLIFPLRHLGRLLQRPISLQKSIL